MDPIIGALVPHPPLLVPEVGGDEIENVAATVTGMKALAGRIAQLCPDVLVMVTPHGPVLGNRLAILDDPVIKGDLGQFGASHVVMEARVERSLASAIADEARHAGIPVELLDTAAARRYGTAVFFDHALMVPMHYLREAGVDVPIVPIVIGFLSYPELFQFGEAIRRVIRRRQERVAILSSGDLSHRLTQDAPAGFHPMGAAFDRVLVDLLAKGDLQGIMDLDEKMIEQAGECGFRPLLIMLGAMAKLDTSPQVLSYEGPFGVGYAVVAYATGKAASLAGVESAGQKSEPPGPARGTPELTEALLSIARGAVEQYVKSGQTLAVPQSLPPTAQGQAGAFVCLKIEGNLRGCIGTILPRQSNLAEEVIHNAISAAVDDPRFPPVNSRELDRLTYSVDIMGQPEPISGIEELDPRRYGVIVRWQGRSGLLLPDLEGVDTAQEQIDIARRKAGIPSGVNLELQRFLVTRCEKKS